MKLYHARFTLSALVLMVLACAGTIWGQQVDVPVRTGNTENLRSVLASPIADTTQGNASLRLDSFTIETTGNKIHLLFDLAIDNPAVVRALLRDGAVMNLTCTITAERLRTVLTNKTVAEATRTYQLRHDPLTREFLFITPQGKTIRHKNFSTLLNTLLDAVTFDLPLEEPLNSGDSYRVRLNISLQHTEVPPWLEKTLFFWSWDVTPPLAFSQDFVY